MLIHPFRALRPEPERAAQVASVPYDTVNSEEARELAGGNADSFLHVTRPEIDLPPGTDPHADAVYAMAAANFAALQARGVLVREPEPCLYVYRQQMGAHVQTGVVACCRVDDYERNLIRKHEKTRQDKEDDRTRHVLTLNANAGPVFLLHKNDQTIQSLIDEGVKQEPLYDFTAVDGVRHTVWVVEDSGPYVEAYRKLKAAYVADGHHRSASAARAGAERRKANPNHTGNEEYNWFLSVLFPADELNILPYNRYVKDLNGLTPEQLINKIGAIALIEKDIDPQPRSTGCFGMYLDGEWYSITLPAQSIPSAADDPIGNLDYVLLYDRILSPMLGIGDIRTDKRIDFVGGIRGTTALERRVNQGGGVAFAMHPVTIRQLTAVADAGEIMPPKSTWFEPKLRSGLLVHTLD